MYCLSRYSKSKYSPFHVIVQLSLIFNLSSCYKTLQPTQLTGVVTDICKPLPNEDYIDTLVTAEYSDSLDRILSTRFTNREIMIAKAAGIYTDLAGVVNKSGDTLQHLLLLQRITGELTLANLEIQSVAGALDCNSDRIKFLADYIDNINSSTTKKLTIGSVTVGAASVIATAAIKNDPGNTIAGVTGGLISAGLAALTISPKGKKVELPLQNVYLSNVWQMRNDNNSFPRFIWTMLNGKGIHSQNFSIIESVRKRWILYQFDGEISRDDENKFFLIGGKFSAGDLHTLENLINELQAVVMSFHQDLKSLIIKLYTFRKVQNTNQY